MQLKVLFIPLFIIKALWGSVVSGFQRNTGVEKPGHLNSFDVPRFWRKFVMWGYVLWEFYCLGPDCDTGIENGEFKIFRTNLSPCGTWTWRTFAGERAAGKGNCWWWRFLFGISAWYDFRTAPPHGIPTEPSLPSRTLKWRLHRIIRTTIQIHKLIAYLQYIHKNG